jgi:hypothetical protein
VQESSMEGSCVVASTCSKASRFFVQLILPPRSTVGFVSNLISFSLKGVEGCPQISASSELL